jgi:hypothetical protein
LVSGSQSGARKSCRPPLLHSIVRVRGSVAALAEGGPAQRGVGLDVEPGRQQLLEMLHHRGRQDMSLALPVFRNVPQVSPSVEISDWPGGHRIPIVRPGFPAGDASRLRVKRRHGAMSATRPLRSRLRKSLALRVLQLGSGDRHSDSPSTNPLAAGPAELALSHG